MQPGPPGGVFVHYPWGAWSMSDPVDAQPAAEFLLTEGWMLGVAMYEAAMSEAVRVPPANDPAPPAGD